VLGEHKGFPFYTIGQRKGLGISAPQPLYVLEIRAQANEIVVGPKEKLYRRGLIALECNWIRFEEFKEPLRAKAKSAIQYNRKKIARYFLNLMGIKS